MTIKIHDLVPAPGSKKAKRRVGRGTAGRRGKTAGRGMKGQKARSKVPAAFEGGQMPLHMRIPKLKGFTNPFRVEYQGINLDVIEASGLDEVTPASLHAKGLAHKGALIKVLGRGELTRKVTVRAHALSRSAEAAITAAGGTVEILPKPWGDRRPPAKGNQFTNR
jgi:large subunit ribosomal protein L15